MLRGGGLLGWLRLGLLLLRLAREGEGLLWPPPRLLLLGGEGLLLAGSRLMVVRFLGENEGLRLIVLFLGENEGLRLTDLFLGENEGLRLNDLCFLGEGLRV